MIALLSAYRRKPLIRPEEVPYAMPEARDEVERAYQAAVEVVERGDLQHLNPYQLASHIHRARAAHLAELDVADTPGVPPPPEPEAPVARANRGARTKEAKG